jgi:hypothetical protein
MEKSVRQRHDKRDGRSADLPSQLIPFLGSSIMVLVSQYFSRFDKPGERRFRAFLLPSAQKR